MGWAWPVTTTIATHDINSQAFAARDLNLKHISWNVDSFKRLPLVAFDAGAIKDVDAIAEARAAFERVLVVSRQLAAGVKRIEGPRKVGAAARLHEHNLLLEIDLWRLFFKSPCVK